MHHEIGLQPMTMVTETEPAEAIDFEQVDFSKLHWTLGEDIPIAKDRMIKQFTAESIVTIENNLYTLHGRCEVSYIAAKTDMVSYEFTVTAPHHEQKLMTMKVGIYDVDAENLFANGTIHRPDRQLLPRDIGMTFYRKLLDFLATLPRAKSILHQMIRDPHIDDIAKWNERFIPMLSERGYEDKGDGTFTKLYPPPELINITQP